MQRDFAALLETCRRGGVEVRSDSRAVARGDIFVAVPGVNEDGARFIPAAVQAGASVVVCRPGGAEEGAVRNAARAEDCRVVYHDDPREALWRLAEARWRTDVLNITVLGVTGTNGKTTSTYLLERLLTEAGHKVGVPFACAAFTNLTQDHLDFHNDMESYFKTKARLFLELPRAEKALAVNADDPWGRRLLELCPRALSFGLQQGPPRRRHLWGELLSAGTDGCHLRMHLKGRTWELRSPLVGAFNASNLLTVQALALEMGLEPEQFVALEGFTGVCGRLERVNNPQGLNVFVDYAHTPDALVNVLKALRGAGFKRIITVFGCGGNRDRSKRPLMGEAVARYADVAVLTSDNPRFEEPQAILQDVLPGLREAREVLVEVDRRTATARALDMLDKDGALLIAGKGHEDYQIIQGVRHHYSDQEVVRELLHCA